MMAELRAPQAREPREQRAPPQEPLPAPQRVALPALPVSRALRERRAPPQVGEPRVLPRAPPQVRAPGIRRAPQVLRQGRPAAIPPELPLEIPPGRELQEQR